MNVPGWKAILSNNEVFLGGDISSWRTLRDKCKGDNLEIIALIHDDEEIDPHPRCVSYFIIYDQATSLRSGQTRTRIGFGSFRENGKARLKWEVIDGSLGARDIGNYTEMVTGDNAMWHELAVPVNRGKDYDQITEPYLKKRGN